VKKVRFLVVFCNFQFGLQKPTPVGCFEKCTTKTQKIKTCLQSVLGILGAVFGEFQNFLKNICLCVGAFENNLKIEIFLANFFSRIFPNLEQKNTQITGGILEKISKNHVF